jgi:hypothetical protein
MANSSPYKDGLAMLDNLLDGKALPDHLARSRAGPILPRHRTQKETAAEEARKFNDSIVAEAAAKMSRQPLTAVCYKHECRCGAAWTSFGFYARKVTQRVPGAADATFTKRLDYDPRPEKVAEVEWRTVAECACLACYGGPLVDTAPGPGASRH